MFNLEAYKKGKENADTVRFNEDKRRYLKAGEEILRKFSLSLFHPILHDFPFMACTPGLDPYSIFGIEAMQNLLLGVSRTLKESLCER